MCRNGGLVFDFVVDMQFVYFIDVEDYIQFMSPGNGIKPTLGNMENVILKSFSPKFLLIIPHRKRNWEKVLTLIN